VRDAPLSTGGEQIWPVGDLCRAIADLLGVSLNPVAVTGEVSGFTRATSGHCYFTLKDDTGQLRCAMFRRSSVFLDFNPRDGDRVQVRGRLGVYEARGELQIVVESMQKAGLGMLFEQFLVLKGKLEREGLFDAGRKRVPAIRPQAIGVVTSLGAAALHDVLTTLARRAPHIPVCIAPAPVQGAGAAAQIAAAIGQLLSLRESPQRVPLDVILLVRGGGSMEDLWAFNDEALVRCIALSPVPVITGVGHETDFTLADFAADLRAPTPTAAAELACEPAATGLQALQVLQERLVTGMRRSLERQNQHVDGVSSLLGRPSGLTHAQRLRVAAAAQHLRHAGIAALQRCRGATNQVNNGFLPALRRALLTKHEQLDRQAIRLAQGDPRRVLERGYAWLSDPNGRPLNRVGAFVVGESVRASMYDGVVDLVAQHIRKN